MATWLKRRATAQVRADLDARCAIRLRRLSLISPAGQGEQANVRVQRYGGRNVPYAGEAEAVEEVT